MEYPSRVIVDGVSTINMVSSMALDKYNLPLSYLQAPTLILREFQNKLCNIYGKHYVAYTNGFQDNSLIFSIHWEREQ